MVVDGTLDLENRRRIYEMIRSRPGTYLREMERELGLQVGTLSYHLGILTEAGMVRAEPEGNHVRYFPSEGFILNDRRTLAYLRSRTTRAILMHILDQGTVSFQGLMALVKVSKSTMSYHLKRLASAGLIKVSKGEETMVSAADPVRLTNLLVWVREDVERDAADALIDVWNRLTER
ncbi:MAG TPA: helix-turn-helix domain-containing protein [Methanomassiliicoccales archaeon]|jgi:predicted transcriptional regulator|nr:helix-turn-helix domain-containing protein [Euryarchaeota archaeon]HOE53245.1 helix-turn-helix domain-containing protein [Methanomassiliicoccales archaeon]HQM66913.1 helix-turn-helix domain-containing protein [Methanomassiliicoccales archaeon]HRR66892.1 helix-turn-helix domain-containing protein [Methanomassiliicoccales archaeon]HRU11760.1 helix-turn-helix domain-containing protein [Methanomassiliicoccales archaeon]